MNKEEKSFLEEIPIVNWFVDETPKEPKHIKVDSDFSTFFIYYYVASVITSGYN